MGVEDDWTVPEADAAEKATDTSGSGEPDPYDSGQAAGGTTPRTHSPEEAAEGDIVEQYQEVPTEDEYREE